ncbi:MAG: hypothetical protein OXI35_13545, partial [Gemmatimonadota bacterium]|nr:hypothetical protein [Gemmatimonadota bacterium]
LKRLSYGDYEVKLFLATVVFSLALHTEAFRKRAMINGGGMGLQGPGHLNREFACLPLYVFRKVTIGIPETRQCKRTHAYNSSISRG